MADTPHIARANHLESRVRALDSTEMFTPAGTIHPMIGGCTTAPRRTWAVTEHPGRDDVQICKVTTCTYVREVLGGRRMHFRGVQPQRRLRGPGGCQLKIIRGCRHGTVGDRKQLARLDIDGRGSEHHADHQQGDGDHPDDKNNRLARFGGWSLLCPAPGLVVCPASGGAKFTHNGQPDAWCWS